MRVKYLLLGVVLVVSFSAVAVFVQANHFTICSPGCNNATTVWWNDTLNITGDGAGGTAVTIRVDSQTMCETNTGAGGWNCTFQAPSEAGKYNLSVAVGSDADDSTLTVRPTYGFQPIGTLARFVSETPFVIQEPSGRVSDLLMRLTITRGILN